MAHECSHYVPHNNGDENGYRIRTRPGSQQSAGINYRARSAPPNEGTPVRKFKGVLKQFASLGLDVVSAPHNRQ